MTEQIRCELDSSVEKDYFVDVAKWGSGRFETLGQEFGGWENIELAVKFSRGQEF